eukprot:ANDGO_05088.mRNA.1 GBP4 protein
MSLAANSALDHPKPLIVLDTQTNKFVIGPAAAQFLENLDAPVAVIAIAGLYRTGKSFILNNLAGRSDGFDVGSTIEPCTKGLWLWDCPPKEVGVRPNLPPGARVVMLDTEGLGSFQQTETYDVQVFAFAVLLSSFFVYNSLGSIDEQAIDRLSLVVQLSKHVRARKAADHPSNQRNQKTENGENSGPEEDSALKAYFPSFLWLVRDFSLELELGGKQISSREYLERALQPMEGRGERTESKNKIRQFIRHFFVDRDCFTLKRPVTDESKLQRISSLPLTELRPEYLEQLVELKERIFNRTECKQIDGHMLTGRMLLELTKEYVDAINKGSVPTISSAWDSVVTMENQKALQTAVEYYTRQMEKISQDIQDTASLLQHHREAETECFNVLRKHAVGNDLAKYETQLKEAVTTQFQRFAAQNDKDSLEFCMRLIDGLSAALFDRVRNGQLKSVENFEQEMGAIVVQYDRSSRGTKKEYVLLQFFRQRVFDALRIVHRLTVEELRSVAESKQKEERELAAVEYARLEKVYEQLQSQHESLSENNKLVHDAKIRLEQEVAEKNAEIERLNGLLATVEARNAELVSKLEEFVSVSELEKSKIVEEKVSTEKEKDAVVVQKQEVESQLESERKEKEEMQRRMAELEEEMKKKKKNCVIC